MGIKCWFAVFAPGAPDLGSRPTLSVPATDAAVEQLFGDARFVENSDLLQSADPDEDHVAAAVFGDVTVLASSHLAVDKPSDIDPRILTAANGRDAYVFCMHSVVDWGAFAWWDGTGTLRRSVSMTPDDGMLEDHGTPLPFESDVQSMGDEGYPLAVHPLDFIEAALAAVAGFCFEGVPPRGAPDAQDIPLRRYALT